MMNEYEPQLPEVDPAILLINELQAFPSVKIGYTEGGWVYFQASDSVIAEISQQLRRRVQRIVRNEYRISLI